MTAREEYLLGNCNELTVANVAIIYEGVRSLRYCTASFPFGTYCLAIIRMRIEQYAGVDTISVMVLPSI